MNSQFIDTLYQQHQQCTKCPTPIQVADYVEDLLSLLFPAYSGATILSKHELENKLASNQLGLTQLLDRVDEKQGGNLADLFYDELPSLHHTLLADADAIYAGDPAASSVEEVIRSYPGFFAVAAYRIAHWLWSHKITAIPRSITEYAHSKTGIDIHPGAMIGERFCIDHGTGVVIGETTVIGKEVKIYQGVTLGALSVAKEHVNTKRHPTIGNHVVIYSGATILGGDTIIGDHAVIGGNVWLTSSVPDHTRVYYKSMQESKIRDHN